MGQRQSSTTNNNNSNQRENNGAANNNNEDSSTRRGRVIRPNSRLNTERNNPLSRSSTTTGANIPADENQRRDERRSRRARIREQQMNGGSITPTSIEDDTDNAGDDRNIVNLMSTVSEALDAMTQNTQLPTASTTSSASTENNGMSPFSRMIAQVISEAVVASFRNGHFPSASSSGIPAANNQQPQQEQQQQQQQQEQQQQQHQQQEQEQQQQQQQNVRQQLTMHLSPELFQQLEPESTEDTFMRFMRLPVILTSVSSAASNEARTEENQENSNIVNSNTTSTTDNHTSTTSTTTTNTAVNADGEAPTLSEGESVTRIMMLPVFLYGLRAIQPTTTTTTTTTNTTTSDTNTGNSGTRSSSRIRERLERQQQQQQQQSPSSGGQWTVYIISGNNVDSVMNESPSYEDLLDLASIIGPARRPTVSQEAIDMHVPIVKFTQQVKQTILGDSDGCQVCLTAYQSEDDVRILQCHHGFHKVCIDKWLTEGQNKCPLCRDVPVPTTATE
jgi:hypothetical protein